MTHEYEIPLILNLGKAVPEVGEIVTSLNANLATFGVEERVHIAGEVGVLQLSVSRPLSSEEETTMRELVEAQLRAGSLPLHAGSLRCKSVSPGCQSESR